MRCCKWLIAYVSIGHTAAGQMSVVGGELSLENLETVGNNLGFKTLSELALFGLIILEVSLDELVEHIVNL